MNWVAKELTKSAQQMGKFEPAAVLNSEIIERVFTQRGSTGAAWAESQISLRVTLLDMVSWPLCQTWCILLHIHTDSHTPTAHGNYQAWPYVPMPKVQTNLITLPF